MKLIYSSKYIVIYFVISTFIFSCTKGFEELNKTPDKINADQATIPGLFNGISKDITTGNGRPSGGGGLYVTLLWDFTNQQAVQNIAAPYITYGAANLWNAYYPVLYDYKKLQSLINANADKDAYKNLKYMSDVLMASKTLLMLDYYGDIPYSKASNVDSGDLFKHPPYDKQADIYKSVLAELQTAADNIDVNGTNQQNMGKSESFLGSDYTAWVKFANALRLRYAVRLYDKDQSLATSIINDIIGGNKLLPQNQQPDALQKNNFGYWPGTISPSIATNDFYRGFGENSVSQLRLSTNMWAQLSANNNTDGSGIFDPRTKLWFEPNNQGKWVPQPQNHTVGESGDPYPDNETRPSIGSDPENKFAAFNIDLTLTYKYFPDLIITEADVYFLKAEIYQRGMGVAKDIAAAKKAYEAGIKSSINFWYAYASISSMANVPPTPTDSQIATLLSNSLVKYDGSNNSDALKKIATQAWIATLWEPQEAWSIIRRTGLPPKDPTYSPIYKVNKLPYPDDEKINNEVNWQAATNGATPEQQALTKVYWME